MGVVTGGVVTVVLKVEELVVLAVVESADKNSSIKTRAWKTRKDKILSL